jgi:hypothetical protein
MKPADKASESNQSGLGDIGYSRNEGGDGGWDRRRESDE